MAQETNRVWQAWMQKTDIAPAFVVPASLSEWTHRRLEMRRDICQLLGRLPPRPSTLTVTTLAKENREDCFFEKFVIDNEAGAQIPGYLLLPKTPGKHPAILYCHWHGGEYSIGKEELFQKAHTPEIPATALIKRGYAVLAVDAYCFGERSGKGPGGPKEKGGSEEMTASKFNFWVGRSLWGMILRDDQIALDYLISRPEIDSNRIGVTGISMGATRSWWLMAVDERIKAGVAVACLTRYQDLIAHEMLSAHGIYYYIPGFLNHFDTESVIALAAPKPLLFLTGDQDGGSPVDGIQVIEKKVKQVYALYGKDPLLENHIYPGVGHVYLPDMWQRMLSWMDQHVKKTDGK